MTPRRLYVLIRALPHDSLLWMEVKHRADEETERLRIARLRERTEYHRRRREGGV